MKKTRIFALLIVICLMVGVFASCGSQDADALTIEEAYKPAQEYDTDYTYTDVTLSTYAENVQNLGNGIVSYVTYVRDGQNNSTIISMNTTYYNLIKNKSIVTTRWEDNWVNSSVEHNSRYKLFVVKEYVKDSTIVSATKLYNYNGDVVASVAGAASIESVGSTFFAFANKLFTVDRATGESSEIATANDFSAEIDFSSAMVIGDYIVEADDGAITYYSKDLKKAFEYKVPSYADDAEFFPLANGSILVQYFTTEDIKSDVYDIYDAEEMVKYTVNWDVITIPVAEEEKGFEVKAVDLGNYYVGSVNNGITSSSFDQQFNTENVPNIAILYTFGANGVNTSVPYYRVINNEAEITAQLPVIIEGRDTILSPIGEGYYEATTNYGESYLVDATGTVVANADNVYAVTAYGIVAENGVYSTALEQVIDFEAFGVNQVFMDENLVIYSKTTYDSEGEATTKYYFFSKDVNNVEPTAPAGYTKVLSVSRFSLGYTATFEKADETIETKYYTTTGEELLTTSATVSATQFDSVHSATEASVIYKVSTVTDSGVEISYRVMTQTRTVKTEATPAE